MKVREDCRDAAHDAIHDAVYEKVECDRIKAEVDSAMSDPSIVARILGKEAAK